MTTEIQPESLLAALNQMNDPRQRGKVIYPLSAMLGILALGMVRGRRALTASSSSA